MIDTKKISIIIPLFNPEEKIILRLKSILPYFTKIFLVDNSEFINNQIVNNFLNEPKIIYVFNGENLGIASAMNIGIKKAISEEFDYILTLDQDSDFDKDSLIKLIDSINSADKVGIYSPFHKNKFFTNPPIKSGLEEVSDVMTSGNILNLEAVKKVGLFREDYFIDYVDIEYCLRLRKNGYKIIIVNDSFLIHNEANLSRIKIFGKFIYPPNHKPFRWYYKIRNYHYLKEEYQNIFPEYFLKESKNIRNNILKVLLFESNKLSKIKFMIKGYVDYKKNKKGRMN